MKIILFILTLVFFALLAYVFKQQAPLFLAELHALGWLGPFCFVLLYSLATLLMFPTMVLTLTGGALFGPWFGTAYNLVGATLGACMAFLIARRFKSGMTKRSLDEKRGRVISKLSQSGWRSVAFLRVVPVIPFNLVNYSFGLTQIRFSHYFLATLIFLAPPELLYTYCGYAGVSLLCHPLSMKHYVIAGTVLLLGLLFALAVNRVRANRALVE